MKCSIQWIECRALCLSSYILTVQTIKVNIKNSNMLVIENVSYAGHSSYSVKCQSLPTYLSLCLSVATSCKEVYDENKWANARFSIAIENLFRVFIEFSYKSTRSCYCILA